MKDGQTIGQWLNWDFEKNGDLEIRDKNGRVIYYELVSLYWAKWVLDSEGNEIYYENSHGVITDNRPPEVIELNGRKYHLIP